MTRINLHHNEEYINISILLMVLFNMLKNCDEKDIK